MAATASATPDKPAALEKLGRIGVGSLAQALMCVPRAHTDYSVISTLREAVPREGVVSEAQLFSLVVSETAVIVPQPKRRIVLTATDGMLSVKIVVFVVAGVNVDFWKGLRCGERFHVRAILQNWAGRLQITGPELVPAHLIGKVSPRYPSKRGIVSAAAIAEAVAQAMSDIEAGARHIREYLGGMSEPDILRHARLTAPSLAALLRGLHAPAAIEEAEASMAEARRLAAYAVVWRARQMKRRPHLPESVIPISIDAVRDFAQRLPHPLTGDQKRAIREICADLASPHPMQRVLSGDVGCGKTYAYMIPALAAQAAGRRVAVLTPNSLLTDQFVQECRAAFPGAAVTAVIGGTKKAVSLEGNPILVGTTALLSRLKAQEALPHLLVIDESQKFSVEQKASLTAAGTNILESTATPIPRTTALVTHGTMDVSIIRECPVVKNIITRIVAAGDARRLYDHTRKVIGSGGQVAIVYPIVEDERQERKSVLAAYERWQAEFPGCVGLIHGGLKEDEKLAVIGRLKAGELKVCVSTTVIELGLTMPSLKSVVVVHAERYGVSQLHQLRGRAARLGGTGYFFLYLPEAVGAETMARLQLLEAFSDGFALAERDAQMRGYGDLDKDAERQHGNSRSLLFIGVDLRPEDIHQFAN
ncbi:MAG: DEAD/DEAH box helicase [Rhodocyclaceae bacterium]|nr:DEAD/DEAH box helicase [Rhodocyclaceae bacterium]